MQQLRWCPHEFGDFLLRNKHWEILNWEILENNTAACLKLEKMKGVRIDGLKSLTTLSTFVRLIAVFSEGKTILQKLCDRVVSQLALQRSNCSFWVKTILNNRVANRRLTTKWLFDTFWIPQHWISSDENHWYSTKTGGLEKIKFDAKLMTKVKLITNPITTK